MTGIISRIKVLYLASYRYRYRHETTIELQKVLKIFCGSVETRLKSKLFSLEILILLKWTNAPRTNVAWTNVVVTVVICYICSKDPLFKV